jgi:hypothetical protein
VDWKSALTRTESGRAKKTMLRIAHIRQAALYGLLLADAWQPCESGCVLYCPKDGSSARDVTLTGEDWREALAMAKAWLRCVQWAERAESELSHWARPTPELEPVEPVDDAELFAEGWDR